MKKKNRNTVAVPVWLIGVLGSAVVSLLAMLWSIKRKTRPHLQLEEIDSPDELRRSLAGMTQGTAVDGNSVRLFQNGAFWDELFATLESAQASIHFETFLSKEGKLTRRLAEILTRKAREGVVVRVTLDGSGGRHFGEESIRQMEEAGCKVLRYHPVAVRHVGRLNSRTHRKMAIVDGRIGFVGGHCLVDTWLGNGDKPDSFRDISARVEGPVVAQLQSAFTDNWLEECGEVLGGDRYFPELERAGDAPAHVVYVSPTGSPSTLKLLHYIAIKAAKKSIHIQNPYFLPDPDARKALAEAARRGVDVRIMVPDAHATDAPFVQHATHHHYGTLLKAGVRIFDFKPTLLHQKVFTVDGEWSSIGSTNFDDRSFEINHEVSLVVYSRDVARELQETFERDAQHAVERKLEPWQHRPLAHKVKDGFSFLFNEQL